MDPVTRYATAVGGVSIAYKVGGEGSSPLMFLNPYSNVDFNGELPWVAEFVERLGMFARLIAYDKRGTGCSDRNVEAPTLEERAEDVLAVLDAVGEEKATLFGVSEGGSLAAYMGAVHPDRVAGIALFGTPSRFFRDDAHPWGWVSRDEMEALVEFDRQTWGTEEGAAWSLAQRNPSVAPDERLVALRARWQRAVMSRGARAASLRSTFQYDLADVFPSVRVPTLLLHRVDDAWVPVAQGRRLAEVMPNAHYVELPGSEHNPFFGDTGPVLAELEEFVTGRRSLVSASRRLLTLLVTDIVGSTPTTEAMGDASWAALLGRFDEVVRRCIARFAGREIKHTGDGFLVTFDGPARAIQCGMAIADGADALELDLRTGIHTGECEVRGDDLVGVALNVVSRLADAAPAGRIVASGTVRDLVAGSGIRFGEGVDVELPGLAGRRTIHEVLRHGTSPSAVRRLASARVARLSREGEYWTAAFEGEVVAIRDSAGVTDLSHLLERPGEEVHALDLSSQVGGASLAPSTTTEVLDDQARVAYKQRLTELDADIDDATAARDGERAARLTVERDQLVEELTSAYGLGDRERAFGEEGERARKAATKRIRTAIDRIHAAHPGLGRHLEATIRTGAYCSYQPDPVVLWEVSR